MVKKSGDHQTLDILTDWTPPVIVKRFDEDRVRAASLRALIARAVGETLHDSELKRDDIASSMSDWLGEDVTKNMLDAYASQAREEHTISYLRILALIHVTGDVRLLQNGAEMFEHVVADKRYLGWIRVGMDADRKEQAEKIQEECDREFNMALREARRRGLS